MLLNLREPEADGSFGGIKGGLEMEKMICSIPCDLGYSV